MAEAMYDLIYRRLLTRVDPETLHDWTLCLLSLLAWIPGATALIRMLIGRPDPGLATRVFGLDFTSPLGVAAGFDKDARAVTALGAFGFAAVEVGTLTPFAQPGNPTPRMARLPADRALVNRMGFNNAGAVAAARRLRTTKPGPTVVGVNIGRNKTTDAEHALDDYVHTTRLVAGLADYLVVNVSSPNTPGLRDLQTIATLRPLLEAVLAASQNRDDRRPPVLVKIAPDLPDEDVDAIADLAVDFGLDGIVVANTSVGRHDLVSDTGVIAGAGEGGLSGPPLAARALALLRRLYARVGDDLTLVSVGGIETADDVWARLTAGASLVQSYTGLVYGGPLFARRINIGLADKLSQHGYCRIGEAVGTAHS